MKVTIYQMTPFGLKRDEATLVKHGRAQYAQYASAAFVHYIPKGKRKATGFWYTFRAYVVVVAGHGHPEPADSMKSMGASEAGAVCSMTRYSSFAPEWTTEAEQFIDALIASGVEVVADYRHTKGFNASDPLPAQAEAVPA